MIRYLEIKLRASRSRFLKTIHPNLVQVDYIAEEKEMNKLNGPIIAKKHNK